MKKFLLSAVACLAMASSAYAGVDKLYGLGGIEGWGNWSGPTAGLELTKVSDGVFTWSGEVVSVAYIAFASEIGTWDAINSHRFSPNVKDAPMVVGDNPMVANKDTSWKLLPGTYSMTIDTNNMVVTLAEQGSVEKVYSYALHGQLDGLTDSDWTNYTLNKESDDLWTAELCPSVTGGSFGVRQILNGADQSDWYSAGVEFNADATTFVLAGEPEGNCVYGYPANTTVKATFVPSTKTLTIVPVGGGVETIEAEAAEAAAVYYNLQGVRVANPAEGMYIRVQAGKASKVVL